jgi:hypothetical protein
LLKYLKSVVYGGFVLKKTKGPEDFLGAFFILSFDYSGSRVTHAPGGRCCFLEG